MNWREEIKTKMISRGVSQRQLAKRLGMSHVEISNMINGKRPMSLRFALGLEFVFIKTAEYWLTCQLKERIAIAKANDGRF